MTALGILNPNSKMKTYGRKSFVDATPFLLRRHLEIYLQAAENKMRNAVKADSEAMWLRGWTEAKEYREQINTLDAVLVEA
jgi:hypothetical protein